MSESDSTTPTTRVCTKCGHEYPATLEYFYAAGSRLRGDCKRCIGARRRAYQVASREKIAERKRAYYVAHSAQIAVQNREYHAAHSEELAVYKRAWRAKHADECAERDRAYHAEHADERREWQRAYVALHLAEIGARNRNRYARKRGNGGTHTAADVQAQYERQHGKCYWCKKKLDKYHVDHVMPVVLGGSNGPENLVISCPTCNLRKGGMHPMEFAGRLL